MSTPATIKNHFVRRVKEIEDSTNLSNEEKESFIFKLQHALEGTNGLTPEQKIQNVSEDVYWLADSMSRYYERYNELTDQIKYLEQKSSDQDKLLNNKLDTMKTNMSDKMDNLKETIDDKFDFLISMGGVQKTSRTSQENGQNGQIAKFQWIHKILSCVVEMKWAITLIILAFLGVMALRPELGGFFERMFKKNLQTQQIQNYNNLDYPGNYPKIPSRK